MILYGSILPSLDSLELIWVDGNIWIYFADKNYFRVIRHPFCLSYILSVKLSIEHNNIVYLLILLSTFFQSIHVLSTQLVLWKRGAH